MATGRVHELRVQEAKMDREINLDRVGACQTRPRGKNVTTVVWKENEDNEEREGKVSAIKLQFQEVNRDEYRMLDFVSPMIGRHRTRNALVRQDLQVEYDRQLMKCLDMSSKDRTISLQLVSNETEQVEKLVFKQGEKTLKEFDWNFKA